MYALDNNSGVVVMPEVKNQQFQPNAPRWFTEGGNGIAPSYPGADWFNIVQAELLNILTDAGMTPDKGQFNQITQAIRAIVSASVKTSLNDKAPIASPIFTGTPKAPTPAQTVNDTTVATTAYVRAAIAALVGTAPATLDTLAEIANALAGDANIKATLLAEIGKKANASHTHTIAQIDGLSDAINARAPSTSPTFSGTVRAPTPAQTVNDTTVATTAYVRAAIAALVGTAPATLDTLSEIANALAGDANVKATLLAEIGKKANISHTHTVSQITDFNQATSQIINAAITYQKIGDFEIRKYPDGTMIQTCRKRMLTGDYSKVNFNWAITFAEMPILTATAQYLDSVGDHDTIITFVQGTSNSACHLVCGETYNNSGEIAYVNVVAIGRWKR